MRILFVVESKSQSAGSVWICLQGLAERLQTIGIETESIETLAQCGSQSEKADVIHVFGWDYPTAIETARAAKRRHKPMIVTPLGCLTPDPLHPPGWIQRIRRRCKDAPLMRSARKITAFNKDENSSLQSYRHRDHGEPIAVGISFDRYAGAAMSSSAAATPRNVLLMGPVDAAHGCVAFLKAFAEIGPVADEWTVTLAGPAPGNIRDKLEAAVRRKGGQARVNFRDAGTIEEQKEHLSRADLLVSPGLRVSPGVSIMQALACGVPVVATDRTAPAESANLIRLCGPQREDLREAIRERLTLPRERLAELGRAGRENAQRLFDWSVLAPRYVQMYEQCLRA